MTAKVEAAKTWRKVRGVDKWDLLNLPVRADGLCRAEDATVLGSVERVGIAYHAVTREGAIVAKRSLARTAMDVIEKMEGIR